MIRPAEPDDFEKLLSIINDGATAYRGVIPAECWKVPYMAGEELRREIDAGVEFSVAEIRGGGAAGAMGVQAVEDVILIRHAYVRTGSQRRGLGTELLSQLLERAPRPVLLGTWKAARWAVRFYEKNGFTLVEGAEKDRLLNAYWRIPKRQVETSVVLADRRAMSEIVKIRPGSAEPAPEPEGGEAEREKRLIDERMRDEQRDRDAQSRS